MEADNNIVRNPIAVSQKPYSPSPQQSHAAGESTPASAGALSWGDLMWPASFTEVFSCVVLSLYGRNISILTALSAQILFGAVGQWYLSLRLPWRVSTDWRHR